MPREYNQRGGRGSYCASQFGVTDYSSDSQLDKFFEHHLRTVAARLEKRTEESLQRQRAAWRDAVRRQSILNENAFDVEQVRGPAKE